MEIYFSIAETITEKKKDILFEHISTEMWIIFSLGLLCVVAIILFSKESDTGIQRFFKRTIANAVFHVFASLLVFLTLEESGEYLIKKFISDFNTDNGYYYVMSGLAGLGGSSLVAAILQGLKMLKDVLYRLKGSK